MPEPTRTQAERSAADGTVTVIRPKSGWQAVDFGELWHSRELLYFLVWRDIKVRYKQTVLGPLWAVLGPVSSMVIFSIIFGKVAKIPTDGIPYPIFVFAGLLPWTFFSMAVTQSANSLVAQKAIITKIYFPRLFVPAACIGAGLVDLVFKFLVYVGIMLWYMHLPGVSVLLLPILVFLIIMTALGTGCFLASLVVSYRDFSRGVGFLTQIWMYASPVVYPVTLLPPQYHWIAALNPMCGIIQAFRGVLLNRAVDWSSLGISSLVAAALLVLGLYTFRRAERRFADIA